LYKDPLRRAGSFGFNDFSNYFGYWLNNADFIRHVAISTATVAHTCNPRFLTEYHPEKKEEKQIIKKYE
jgi:hypothetical protein